VVGCCGWAAYVGLGFLGSIYVCSWGLDFFFRFCWLAGVFCFFYFLFCRLFACVVANFDGGCFSFSGGFFCCQGFSPWMLIPHPGVYALDLFLWWGFLFLFLLTLCFFCSVWGCVHYGAFSVGCSLLCFLLWTIVVVWFFVRPVFFHYNGWFLVFCLCGYLSPLLSVCQLYFVGPSVPFYIIFFSVVFLSLLGGCAVSGIVSVSTKGLLWVSGL